MPLDPLPAWVISRRQHVGRRIREARRNAALSQLKLGEHVGLDHKTIHRFEYGLADPSLTDLLLIADALDVSVLELLYGADRVERPLPPWDRTN